MTMRTAVWFVSVVFKVLEQDRPERVLARSDDGPGQASPEHAVPLFGKLAILFARGQVIISSMAVFGCTRMLKLVTRY